MKTYRAMGLDHTLKGSRVVALSAIPSTTRGIAGKSGLILANSRLSRQLTPNYPKRIAVSLFRLRCFRRGWGRWSCRSPRCWRRRRKHEAWKRAPSTLNRGASLVEDRGRRARVPRDQRERQTGGEERGCKHSRGLGQSIAGAPAGHETTAAANAERFAFGALQQHHGDQRDSDHDVNNEKHCGHLVAFDLPGGVLSESATAWLGLPSPLSAAGIVGFRSGSGMVLPFSGAVVAFSGAASLDFAGTLTTPPPRQRNWICSSTLKKCLTRSIASSFRWSLTQSGPWSRAACMSRVRSFFRSICRLAQLSLSSGSAMATAPARNAAANTRPAKACGRSSTIDLDRQSPNNPIE